MLYIRKFLDELATIHLIPDEIDLHKVPSRQEFRKACYDNISSYFMKACAAISPEMAEDFRREQEEQERRKDKIARHLPVIILAESRKRQAHGRQTKSTSGAQTQNKKNSLNFLLI